MEPTDLDVVPEPGHGLVDRLAQQLGLSARAHHIFGPAVDREGITVIPVGRVRYAFGGGAGEGGQGREQGRGNGGGGGVRMEPAGFIQVRDGDASWRPIRRPTDVAGAAMRVMVGAGLATFLVMRGIRALRGGGRAMVQRRPGRWTAVQAWTR